MALTGSSSAGGPNIFSKGSGQVATGYGQQATGYGMQATGYSPTVGQYSNPGGAVSAGPVDPYQPANWTPGVGTGTSGGGTVNNYYTRKDPISLTPVSFRPVTSSYFQAPQLDPYSWLSMFSQLQAQYKAPTTPQDPMMSFLTASPYDTKSITKSPLILKGY